MSLAGSVPAVNLRIRGAGGVVADERVVPLDAEARVSVTLPSGRYTIEAFYLSATDGSVQWVDDHDFNVA